MIESAAVIKGVRDKSVLSALGLSRRTVVRLGVLLARGLAFTEAVLESAEKGSPLEKLILSDALPAAAAELSSENLASLCADAGVADTLTVLATGEGRTVALEEEVEAEGAWEGPAQEQAGSLARLARAPALTPSASGGEARAELFTAAEIEKLKLTALTSARAEEAVGAMRQLAYSPLSAQERGEVFVRALAALDPEVRAEASRLLAGVGLQPDISEALVSLAAGEEAEKNLAVDRLGQALAERGGKAGEADLMLVSSLVALTASLSAEHSSAVRGHVLSSLARAAGVLAAFPERMAEVVRHIVELLVSDYPATIRGATDLLDAAVPAAPGDLDALLRAELRKTRDPRVRTFLLGHLAAAARLGEDEAAKAETCRMLAEEFAAGRQDASDQQALAGELYRLPAEHAAAALIDNFPGADMGPQRHFLRLLSDVCRYREVPDAILERTGELFLRCLEGAAKELRLGVLETILPASPRLSPGLRARLAEAYIESFSDLVFRADIELAESTLAHMGPPALPVLLDRLGPSWPADERTRACRIVGEMGRLAAAGRLPAADGEDQLREAARQLLRASTATFPEPGVLAVAMGKVSAAIERDPAALQAVWRRVEEMNVPEHFSLEALSWVASGPAASRDMAEASCTGLMRKLSEPEPESLGEIHEVRTGGERSLELSSAASDFVNAMPAVVRGLARVAQAPASDPPMRSRILTAMINRWKDLISGRRIWGPAAATTIIEGLRDLASAGSAKPAEKLEVIRALGRRLADPPAMRAIAEVLSADSASPQLAGPASSAALALLGLKNRQGRFPEDDREHILWCLAQIIGRKTLDTSDPRTAKLRERILEELYDGLNDGVNGVYDAMASLARSDSLPAGLRSELSERLAARSALTLRPGPARGRRS